MGNVFLFIVAVALVCGFGFLRRKRKMGFGLPLSCAALAFMLSTATKASAENVNALVLHLSSGNRVTCLLDEKPVVTFKSGELVVTTHMNVISYQESDVKKFTYTYADPSDISSVKTGSTFSFNGNALQMSNLTPSSQVSVYTVGGVLVTSARTGNNGSVTLSLPEQSGAVYVVKTSVANFKISRP